MTHKKLIIGITGGSASGKSSYAKNLCDFLSSKCKTIIISMDNFYKGLSQFSDNELELFQNNKLNLDAPSIINFKLLIQVVSDLLNNRSTKMPIYERMKYDSVKSQEITDQYDVIIVEGIFIFTNKILEKMMDIKIFMDVSDQVRLDRRKQRYDQSKLDKQIEYYNTFVCPAYKKYILPQKQLVDFVINGEKQFHSTLTTDLLGYFHHFMD